MRRVTLIVLAVLAVSTVAACSGARPSRGEHPAVLAVESLLELRRDDVRDADAYATYLADPAVASALAEPSGEPTGTPRVPEWETPYVSEEGSGTASVVVVWKPDAMFEDWPAVNVFLTEIVDGRWVVTDALEATSAPVPIGGARE